MIFNKLVWHEYYHRHKLPKSTVCFYSPYQREISNERRITYAQYRDSNLESITVTMFNDYVYRVPPPAIDCSLSTLSLPPSLSLSLSLSLCLSLNDVVSLIYSLCLSS